MITGPNQANFYNGVWAVSQINSGFPPAGNALTDVGAYSTSASYYGTFDQTGDVYNLTEGISGPNRIVRGGSWDFNSTHGVSSFSIPFDPTFENYGLGFRLAAAPEPTSAALLLGSGAMLLLRRRRA